MKQNTNEWLAMRKNFLGASDAPIIMGVCKFKTGDGRKKTPHILWQEKLGLFDIEVDNFATHYGKIMEEPAREIYQQLVGDIFEPAIKFHPDINYLMASLDGLNKKKDRAVEIKNASRGDHETAKEGKVPDHYYPQVQQQLGCTGHDVMDYFSLWKGDGVIVEVKRNNAYLDEYYKKAEDFWKCVENFEEPPLTEDDYVPRDDQWKECAERLWTVKEEKKAVELEEKALVKLLEQLSCKVNSRAGSFRYGFYVRKGNVDYKLIPELKNVDLNKHRKEPIKIWKLQNKG